MLLQLLFSKVFMCIIYTIFMHLYPVKEECSYIFFVLFMQLCLLRRGAVAHAHVLYITLLQQHTFL